MPYLSRIFVAALLILSAGQAGFKALALPLSTLVSQATTTFPVPESVPSGTELAIQSSPNLGIATQSLKEGFEQAYDGTAVNVEITSSDQALQALLAGDVDLAAIGRPLTEEEMAEGLETVPLERAKIAIIIGPNNPFNGNLTFEQFAAMFRGEITDWSEVGGTPGPIRFVDRPEDSDTRRSLSQYEVFRTAPFETGATADPVAEDDTATVIAALGNDGIGYAIAPHVLEQEEVKIISMHQTLPDDPRYPYSQPRYFVFKDAPNAAAAAFLGYATSPQGTEVLTTAQQSEAGAIAAEVGTAPEVEATPAAAEPAEPAPEDSAPVATAPATTEERGGLGWWWWLLPLLGLGALAWALTRRRGMAPVATAGVEAPPAVVPPAPREAPVASPPVVDNPPPPVIVDEVAPPVPTALVTDAVEDIVEPVETSVPVMPTPVEPALVELVEPAPIAPAPVPPPPIREPEAVPVVAAAVGAAGLAANAAASLAGTEDQSVIEASKYNVVGHPANGDIDLSTIDDGLPPLPEGYGESRIVLMPRDPQWAYAYWDTPNHHKEDLRRQGGERLALRLYDVTDVDLTHQAPHSMQQFDCDELAREWYLQIPVSDRDYQVEIGYLAADGRWLVLARSNTVRIPPVYPSDWSEDHFLTVTWDESLRGKTLMTLIDPRQKVTAGELHEQMYALSQPAEWERIAGSMFGSMQHVPGSMVPSQAISSYAFPSGVGMAVGPAALGAVPTLSGIGLNVSGLTMSGIGFAASMPPIRPRKFWLVADAELIVYGATEPDATVTISGQPIQLTPEGTFRFHTAFPDGRIDYPVMAVAADGEQNRSIHMTFDRQTPERRTNTREEAQEEWPEG
jgi:hypothetical protein